MAESNTENAYVGAENLQGFLKGWTGIKSLALMLLKQSDIKLGMAGKRKACGWDEKIRDKVMGIQIHDKIKKKWDVNVIERLPYRS